MNITKHIIDQRIDRIIREKPEWFEGDDDKKKSQAFVLLTVATYLDIDLAEAHKTLTDKGGDSGIDAIYIGDPTGLELPVTIFQGKYKKDLARDTNFPANEVQKAISAIWTIFDASKTIDTLNDALKPEVEEIRSLVGEGYIPRVTVILVNNGLRWTQEGQQHIDNAHFPGNQVLFEHVNHESIVGFIQSPKEIKASFKLSGIGIVEDFNYRRVLIGKMAVSEVSGLFETHGDALLEKNIRKYLGLRNNRVNAAIQETLLSPNNDSFYFKNNGITMVCKKIAHNALQREDWIVSAEDLQIVNGGQTCKTIQSTLSQNTDKDFSKAFVLIRLYELSGSDEGNVSFVNEITLATNSQNPVDLTDLRSNDDIQLKLETDIKELGYVYRRKKDIANVNDTTVIPLSVAAQAIYSVWKEKPHLAKPKRAELFGSYYTQVYTHDLNAAHVVISVLIYRYCDNQRRNYSLMQQFPHIPFSNYFMSMIIGRLLLQRMEPALLRHGEASGYSSITRDYPTHDVHGKLAILLKLLTHGSFGLVKDYFEQNKDTLFNDANNILIAALNKLHPDSYTALKPRTLSSIFRREDLYEYIDIEFV